MFKEVGEMVLLVNKNFDIIARVGKEGHGSYVEMMGAMGREEREGGGGGGGRRERKHSHNQQNFKRETLKS